MAASPVSQVNSVSSGRSVVEKDCGDTGSVELEVAVDLAGCWEFDELEAAVDLAGCWELDELEAPWEVEVLGSAGLETPEVLSPEEAAAADEFGEVCDNEEGDAMSSCGSCGCEMKRGTTYTAKRTMTIAATITRGSFDFFFGLGAVPSEGRCAFG